MSNRFEIFLSRYLHFIIEVMRSLTINKLERIEWWRDYCTVSDVTEHAVVTERYLANAIISDKSK